MLPALGAGELEVVGAVVACAIIFKMLGNETRNWLMLLAAVTLSPSWQVAVVAAVMAIVLRAVDLVNNMRG